MMPTEAMVTVTATATAMLFLERGRGVGARLPAVNIFIVFWNFCRRLCPAIARAWDIYGLRVARASLTAASARRSCRRCLRYWSAARRVLCRTACPEVEIVGRVEVSGEPVLVSGRVDRLVVDAKRVLVVDYKSDREPAADCGGCIAALSGSDGGVSDAAGPDVCGPRC